MAYYRDSVTEKSWQLLQTMQKDYQFVLIGGWAVWLYTRQLKSKDIDIVVELNDLERLRQIWAIEKNERLQKYQFRQGEVEVDVYAPYYSNLGISAEVVMAHKQLVDGFWVPEVELLFGLKVVSWLARRGSAKGKKDWLDMVSILAGVDYLEKEKLGKWREYELVSGGVKAFKEELALTTRVEELGLNVHQMARAKKKWLEKL